MGSPLEIRGGPVFGVHEAFDDVLDGWPSLPTVRLGKYTPATMSR
jgi:hypothetical protein